MLRNDGGLIGKTLFARILRLYFDLYNVVIS
jgi:hypothetical protein